MDGNVSSRPVRRHFRRGWLVLGVACAALLLVTGCGGGGKNKASGTSTGQVTVQQLDKFASCMRHNGVPSFYFAPYGSTPTSDSELSMRGYLVPGVGPNTPNFAMALKACQSVNPLGLPGKTTRQQFDSQLRFAECMRTHGFPAYPDPTEQNGRLTEQPLPSSIDQNSPQFQKAENTCSS